MNRKKLLSLLLAFAMAFTMAVPAMAAEDEAPAATPYSIPADVDGKLVVIHTNDVHGHDVAVEGKTVGTAGVAALKKDFEAAGATVLLLSAGDFSQGTTLVSLDKGASAVAFMNAAGYDAAALGNHEFDYKMDALNANVAAAGFPILAANIVDTATKKPVFGDSVTFDTAIGKVGVFGLDTPEAMTKAHPDNVRGLTFYQDDELVACAQAQADALKADGCDYIIALTHLGVDPESEPNRSTDVFATVTGVDLVVDGHSHTEMDGGLRAGGALVVSTGEYLNKVGVVITDGTDTTARLVSAAEYTKLDAGVADVVNAKAAEVEAEMGKSFGTTEVLLNGERDPGNRTEETNLGDFATDALLWQAKKILGEDKVDAALTNGGGIRASIQAGPITMNDMKTVFPFGNTVVTIDVTGAKLLEALEAATCSTPTAIGAFPQVSGIEFTVNTAVEYVNGNQYPDSTYFAPAEPGSRVTIATVGGEDFNPTDTYTIATNDFTAAGGDTYHIFKSATNKTMTAVALEDALINYTKEVLGGTITAERYGEPAGRITIVGAPVGEVPAETEAPATTPAPAPDPAPAPVPAPAPAPVPVPARAPAAPVDDWSDVDSGEWYAGAVRYVMSKGLMGSTSATAKVFSPYSEVTRATVYQALYNLEGRPEPPVALSTFTDIQGKWYADAATWAERVNLVRIPASGHFDGDRPITRAELATILVRYAELKGLSTTAADLDTYADVGDVIDWSRDSISRAIGSGLMAARDGLLVPTDIVFRADLAVSLMNMQNLTPAAVAAGVSPVTGEMETPAAAPEAIVSAGSEDTPEKAAAVPVEEFLRNKTGVTWFLTGKTSYTIQGMMVAEETTFTNNLEGTDYTALPNGEDVVLKGTAGERWIAPISKVISTYTKPDGSALAAGDFTPGQYIDLRTKAAPDSNFACHVPLDTLVEVHTAWGDVLYANRPEVEHGQGDYLVCTAKDGQPDLSDVWVVNGATFPQTYDMTWAAGAQPTQPIESAGYTESAVAIEVPETDDIPAHTIPGILTLPQGEGRFPAVVMLHGTGSEKNEAGGGYALAAPVLAEAGIASLRIDFMGNGESTASYTDYNYTSARLDAKAAADYLSAHSAVDSGRLGVMGWSQGGTDALLAAAKYPETFQAVVTWSGAVTLDGTTLFPEGFDKAYEIARRDGVYTMNFDWREPLQLGPRWFEEVQNTDVLQETAKISAPLLAVNGDQDTTVTPDNAVQIAKAAQNGTGWLIDGADHTYNVFAEEDHATLLKTAGDTAAFFSGALAGSLSGSVAAVSKYGNITTDIPLDGFALAGFEAGDILNVTVGGQTLSAPFGDTYSNVDNGQAIVVPDKDTGCAAVAINMGSFAGTYGAEVGGAIAISMGEKQGYLEEYRIRNIDALRTNDRADYASDQIYANFRPILMGDIAQGVLYRVSSPVNPELGRNGYADQLIEEAGVRTVLNLADDEETLKGYEGYADSYYATLDVVTLDMGVDFSAPEFSAKLKTGLEFLLAHEGPYAVHCNEGKDRAGFVSALLEALMGGELGQIVDDYMMSYENYYHVEHNSGQWTKIAQSNIMKTLCMIAGVDSEDALDAVDLRQAAADYLTGTVGLTAGQVAQLQAALSTPVAAEKAA